MEANPYFLKDANGGYYNKYPEFEIWEQGRQAGRREVVEWIENHGGSLDAYRNVWQAFLKEKGVKKEA